MNTTLNLIYTSLLLALAWPLALQAQTDAPPAGEGPDFPPKKYEPRRYDAIFQKNPFVREIQVVEQEEAVDEWAKDLTLRGYSKMNGKFVVHIENKKLENEKDIELRRLRFMRLVEGEPMDVRGWGGPSKLTLLSVTPSRDPKEVEIRLQGDVGGGSVKTATIGYDEKDLQPKAGATKPAATARATNANPRTRRVVNPRQTSNRGRATTRRTTNPGRRVVMPPGLNNNR